MLRNVGSTTYIHIYVVQVCTAGVFYDGTHVIRIIIKCKQKQKYCIKHTRS